ncbi:dihydrofolate synthase / folylpolyglutamate synthase [Arboricoccus pini]|uniref:Dihydrofolate synthase/folylpolyglutamate synthase n=1 Tax=Arboricoccus pini TaxID=1963835 RepID=A0A212R707_9PROT|nr:folylpolyglutamate synthase/dihydrofolate synthase family protein [Arboricoccus pini]SNB67942.1 dihydrofolate synthase / folylpolyglutamate synthase [Arboricoccus pini]
MSTLVSDLILARLSSLHPKKIDLSLGRVSRLLEALGHPERHLPPIVHIAGTNGKGSTLAMLHAMIDAAGLRAHRYISPHLVRFNERIMLNGQPIDEARLSDCLDRCERANADQPITFFEITTAAAFLAMAADSADLVLLETGLGGLYDATNVIDRPALSLLTPISMDHEAFLGDNISKIAISKAGILKPGCLGIVGPQPGSALDVIKAHAAEIGAPLLIHGRDWLARAEDDFLVVEDGDTTISLPRPALKGAHQIQNGGLAVMAARHLPSLIIDEHAIASGLRRVVWPARLQRLTQGPLVESLGGMHDLWLDGGHNPAAGEVLAESLGALSAGRPVHLVVGMLQTKDFANFLKPLVSRVASITTVPLPEEPGAGHAAEELAAVVVAENGQANIATSLEDATAGLARRLKRPSLVLICGALYLAGYVLRTNS